MKVDSYTKAVLTVIAACLVVLTLQNVNIIPRVHAAPFPGAALAGDEVKVNFDGSINVRVIEVEPAVKISTPFDGLPVQLKDVDTRDKIQVEVTNSYISTKPY